MNTVVESLIVEQNGQHLSVNHEVIQQLGDLVGRRIVTRDDLLHGYVTQKELVSLLRAPDGRRLPNSGLFPALQWRARQQGIQLQRRITPTVSSLPHPVHLERLSYPQVAYFVHRASLGRIGIHAGIKPEDVIADLTLAFPDAKIVVLGGHSRQLSRIGAVLRARKIRATSISSRYPLVVVDDSGDDDQLPNVICSTPREAANIDFAIADIVILLDAAACPHADMQMALSQIDARFRLYGLFDVTRGSAPSVVDAMMATFGPEVLQLQAPRHVRREVNVAWVPIPPPNNDLDVTDADFGKQCYWRHERRNRRIKQLANGLRSSAPLDRRQFGDVARVYGQPGYRLPSVTILVDRPTHALELSRLLPDWPVFVSDDDLHGLGPSVFDSFLRRNRPWLDGSHQIVVARAAPDFTGEMSEVVIWAGGGGSIDFISHQWLRVADGLSKPLLIIDFDDGHNKFARRLSRDRQKQYFQLDMFPVGISTAQGRLAMFLDRQPRRVAP